MTNTLQKRYENTIYSVFALIAIIAMIVGLVITINFGKDTVGWKITGFFLTELGVAIIIALVIIFTIEKFTRNRHEIAAENLIGNINENLFHAIYKRYIPPSLFAEVEQCLLRSKVFRRNHRLDYTINNIPPEEDQAVDPPEHVQCTAHTRYTLENITNIEIEHPVKLVLERPIDKAWDEKVKVLNIEIDGTKLSDEDISKHTTRDEVQVLFSYPIKLKPGQAVEISTEATLLKRKDDAEIWASLIPSDGFELTVSIPSQDLEIQATANNSAKLSKILDNYATQKWELRNALFPYQSVIWWWHKK